MRQRARHGQDSTIRRLTPPLSVLLLVLIGVAGADHGGGDLRAPTNPWWEAVLWGVLGFLVAITVTLVVVLFTRSPAKRDPGERSRS
ncbi:MAG: hypothetical protein L0Z49_10000 [Actinobacteria bacterium]|nr:hypothetical protein [Actinomycetota bacterium]